MSPRETITSVAKGLDRMIYQASEQHIDRYAALSIHQPILSRIWNVMTSVAEISIHDSKYQ
jgi:hypothetical protein